MSLFSATQLEFPFPDEKLLHISEVKGTVYFISAPLKDVFRSIYYLRRLRLVNRRSHSRTQHQTDSCIPELSPKLELELPETCPYYRNFDESGGKAHFP